MEKLSIRVYRHKEYKNVYLMRNWNYCGGGPDTEFYAATTDLKDAINSVMRGNEHNLFEDWFNAFDGKLYALYTDKKEMEFDGYSGVLTKEIKLYVKDFEKVVLEEV